MSIQFRNLARPFEVNARIIEWDVKRAGLNICKEFGLLPDNQIEEIHTLSKIDGDTIIGKMQLKDKSFSKNLEQKFTDVMKEFISLNDLDMDLDILNIKKDACFVINKEIRVCTIGTHIQFIPKNEYHAYISLNPYEFYFQPEGSIEVKGLIHDRKERERVLQLHQDGILMLLESVVDLAETSNMNKHKLNQFLHEFVEMYKKKELDFDFYREFNVESRFRYQMAGGEIMADSIDAKMLEKVNIEYNYKKIILPLINIIC